MSDKVRNPEDRFSHNEAHISQDNWPNLHLMLISEKETNKTIISNQSCGFQP